MSTDDIIKEYLDCIEEITLFCQNNTITDNIRNAQRRILNILDSVEISESDMISRSRDMNILYPRQYSLLYRVVSSFNIHLFMLSRVKPKKGNTKHDLISELSIAWDLCNEILELQNEKE